MAFSDSVGLLFSIKTDASSATKELSAFRSTVDKEVGAIEASGKNAFANFTQGLGLSTEKTAQLSAALPALGIGIGAVAGAAIGAGTALFAIAKQASDFGSAIFDVTQKTGLGAKSISTLKFAADQSGSSLEAVSGSISRFSKLIGSSAEGSDKATASLVRLGLDPKKAIGDLDGSLEKVFKTIYDAQNPIVATKLATEAFGKSGADLIPVIKTMDGDFAAFQKRAEELGVVLSDADVKAADEFGDTLDTLKAQAASVGLQFAKGLMPAITSAMREIGVSLKNNRSQFTEWGEHVGNVILRLVRGVSVFAAVLKDFAASSFLGGISTVNTTAALTSSAAGYERDRRDAARRATLNDPNRPDFLKSQDAGIERLGKKAILAADSLGELSGAAGKSAKTHRDTGAAVATLLPRIGDGFKAYAVSQKQFGTANTIENLTRLAAAFKETTGKIVGIGEIAIKGGGKFFPHEGHRGTTADLRPIRVDGGGGAVRFDDLKNYDREATRRLVQIIKAENPGAIVLFNDPQLIREGLTRRAKGHDNHLDVSGLGGKGKDVDLEAIAKKRKEDATRDAEKAARDVEQANEKKVKLAIASDKRILESAQNVADEEKAMLDQFLAVKIISQEAYAARVAQIDIDLLEKERAQLEERLKLTILKPEERADIEAERDAITQAIKIKGIDAETAAIKRNSEAREKRKSFETDLNLEISDTNKSRNEDFFNRERERYRVELEAGRNRLANLEGLASLEKQIAESERADIEERLTREEAAYLKEASLLEESEKVKESIRNLYRLKRQQADDEAEERRKAREDEENARKSTEIINSSGAGRTANIFGELAGGGVDPENKIKSQADYLKAVHEDLAASQDKAIGAMVSGLSSLATQWVLTGKISGKAALQMVAGVALGFAIQAGFKALFEYAEGIAAAANPFTAALAPGHFAAAAAYGVAAAAAGAVGIGTGLLSRAVGGKGGGSSSGGSRAFAAQTSFRSGSGSTTNEIQRGSGTTATTYSSYGDKINSIGEGRNQPQVVEYRHTIQVEARDDRIVRIVSDNITGRGELHGLVIKTIDA
jgi:hypothetical protein